MAALLTNPAVSAPFDLEGAMVAYLFIPAAGDGAGAGAAFGTKSFCPMTYAA